MRILLSLALFAGCHGQPEAARARFAEPPALAAPATIAAADVEPAATQRPPSRPAAADTGVFSDLDPRVVIETPAWVDTSAALHVANRHGDIFIYVGGRAVGLAAPGARVDVTLAEFVGCDRDGDAIPDELDILIGATKAALNGAPYGSPYREIDFPGGDVPRDEGVCTDVLVRALRNAGHDLQESLQRDIARRRSAFPMVKTPNANIDHRRVKTLLPHFQRSWIELRPEPDDPVAPWLPGDVIFMQTMGDARPDHVGIVADELGATGSPLIVNNFTTGYATSAMDIARLAPITHRFRFPSELSLPEPHGGLHGVLQRNELTLPENADQVLVVTVPGWHSVGGSLRRFARTNGAFVAVGKPIDVTIGAAGLGGGRGLDVPPSPATKREGDRRSPAGVFTLGTSFGQRRTVGGRWPYRRVGPLDRFVDDPSDPGYNSWQVAETGQTWASAEKMDMYELGLVVEHNMPAEPGMGSAIFLHTWQGAPAPTVGCTAMSEADMTEVIRWLEPERHPVLVQVADHLFEESAPD